MASFFVESEQPGVLLFSLFLVSATVVVCQITRCALLFGFSVSAKVALKEERKQKHEVKGKLKRTKNERKSMQYKSKLETRCITLTEVPSSEAVFWHVVLQKQHLAA